MMEMDLRTREEKIRDRAYDIWESRCRFQCEDANDEIRNWVDAEFEVDHDFLPYKNRHVSEFHAVCGSMR
jgi:hypothetical protein